MWPRVCAPPPAATLLRAPVQMETLGAGASPDGAVDWPPVAGRGRRLRGRPAAAGGESVMTTLLLVLAGLGGGTVGLGLMACVAARRMARMEQRIAALRHLLAAAAAPRTRSEEHTSELQSPKD